MTKAEWAAIRQVTAWPLGTLWRWQETLAFGSLSCVLAFAGAIELIVGQPRRWAMPIGAIQVIAGYWLWRVVMRHRSRPHPETPDE